MTRTSRLSFIFLAALAVSPVTAQAGDMVCKGNIISIQGEGLVARRHRFEVESVSGSDVESVVEKCKKIAQDKQNRAARKNPGGNFKPFSEVDLQCQQDGQKSTVRRSIRTTP